MKKGFVGFWIVLLCITVLCGCQSAPSASSVSLAARDESAASGGIVHEGLSVKLIRTIMELDYASMSVQQFNNTIQELCAEQDTSIFAVISDAYDHYYVSGESGDLLYYDFGDKQLKEFMETTLSYSAQEIFGEPVHMGSVMYMTMPGKTAVDMAQQEKDMSPEEWHAFFEQNIQDISIFPVFSYEIEAETPNADALLVSERDTRLNSIHAAIHTYLLSLDAKAAAAETLADDIAVELKRLSLLYSDDKMAIVCRIQSIERDL